MNVCLNIKCFVCSSHVCLGFLEVLRFPPTSHKHTSTWIGFAKLPLSVNEYAKVSAWCPIKGWLWFPCDPDQGEFI